ncbi:MAG: hypothetical protein K2G51_11450 [Lachnospiraceae bacterium]|nr:hypothetical protein [Lachnospiraceae bacterium]
MLVDAVAIGVITAFLNAKRINKTTENTLSSAIHTADEYLLNDSSRGGITTGAVEKRRKRLWKTNKCKMEKNTENTLESD